MLFGGAGGYGWPDAVVQLAALPLLAWALFKLTPSELGRGGRWAIGLLCAILAWPLLQLIPMPPSLWSDLPGRGEIASAYEAAGMTLPWLPISLYPTATWLGLLSLVPATAVFLAMLSLEQRSRRVLIFIIFIVIFASAVLDMLQIMGGEESPLRFYAVTNPGRAVGFFANSNHNAAFLYSAIPFVTAYAIGLLLDHRRHRAIGLVLLALLILAIIIGLSLTQSRAGMALLLLRACLVCCWLGDIIRVNQVGASCALRLVPTLSRCSWHSSSDLLHSRSAQRGKVSKICAGRSPRLRRKPPSQICRSAAVLEPSRRFMRSSHHERFS